MGVLAKPSPVVLSRGCFYGSDLPIAVALKLYYRYLPLLLTMAKIVRLRPKCPMVSMGRMGIGLFVSEIVSQTAFERCRKLRRELPKA